MEKSLRIKLYGESFKIHKLKIHKQDYRKCQLVAEMLKQPLEMALINVDFFRLLNHPSLNTINDLIDKSFGGLVNNAKNRIEIGWGRRRIAKLGIQNLMDQQTLFPLYQAEVYKVSTENMQPGLYLLEREIGLIGQYETKANNFNFDDLQFHLTKTNFQNMTYQLLNFLTYQGTKIPLSKTDCLLTYQQVLIAK